jgi:4-amino-4-deoxy-L-arabinose transferase-like glycosyltransferase
MAKHGVIKNSAFIFIFLITLIGAFFRIYNLNWGAPFYFHPDERNIASAVSQLQFPEQMNPHFFAYGSLPIYTIYFTGVVANVISEFSILNSQFSILTVTFNQAIIISRFYSAVFSILLIPLLYILGKKLKDKQTGLLAAFLATMSVGFIQFAHFGTFEMWLTFFSTLLFFLCLNERSNKTLLLIGIILGILIATKISSLVLFPVLIFAAREKNALHDIQKNQKDKWLKYLITIFSIAFISLIVFCLTNPYVFLDYHKFAGDIQYESNVALGSMNVFYTGEFYDTTPIIFQLLHVFPFLINPLMTVLFIISFFSLCNKAIKQKEKSLLLLLFFFLILFLSQAVLYVKWVRYMMPTLPFMYLMSAIALFDFFSLLKKKTKLRNVIGATFLLVCFLFGLSYFITAFIQQDTRIAAVSFAKKTIPGYAYITTETYDLGIMPFNNAFHNIALFNSYELDNNSFEYNNQTLNDALMRAEYIILPSQRVSKIRLKNEQQFPVGHDFYSSLFNGKLGFTKIYETPCDIFCKITYLNNPVLSFEQTANVFDRPEVYIFKKNSHI